MITFSRDGSVHLPDTGRVEVRSVHSDRAVRKHGIQHLQAPLHQVAALLVIRKIDPIEQVCPVPRVGHNRVRPPPFPPKIRGDLGGPDERCLVLLISRGHTGWSRRVNVDGEPAPVDNISVSGRCVLLREPHLDTVRPPREKGRVHLVQGDVDAGGPCSVQRSYRFGQGLGVIEVPRCHPLLSNRTDLNHLSGFEEEGEGLGYLLARHVASPGEIMQQVAVSSLKWRSTAPLSCRQLRRTDEAIIVRPR